MLLALAGVWKDALSPSFSSAAGMGRCGDISRLSVAVCAAARRLAIELKLGGSAPGKNTF